MCIRCLEECREKGEGAGVPEAKGGGRNHEKTRMDTKKHLTHEWTRMHTNKIFEPRMDTNGH